MIKIINIKWALPFMGVMIGCISVASGQVKKIENKVIPTAELREIEGKFYPLFWTVNINGAKSFIPLAHVDTFGVQVYRVDDHLVTEFTVALKSRTYIRFYHLKQEGKEARKKDFVRNRGNKNVFVIKDYPVTTHKEMMEYRLGAVKDVNVLMKHFYATYLDYKMKDYVKEQRGQSVNELDLNTNVEEEDERSPEEKALEKLNDIVPK